MKHLIAAIALLSLLLALNFVKLLVWQKKLDHAEARINAVSHKLYTVRYKALWLDAVERNHRMALHMHQWGVPAPCQEPINFQR